MKLTCSALLVGICVSATASAQPAPRVFVAGTGGVTFVTETAEVWSASVGVPVHDRVQVIGEVGRLTNVLPRKLQGDLDEAARSFGSYFGGPLTIDGEAPGVYGLATLRLIGPNVQRATLFVDAGGGIAYGKSDITARAGGSDVTEPVLVALHMPKSETRPVLALGGGVGFPVSGRVGVDIGYRYMRIFTEDPRINTAAAYATLRFGF